MSEAAAKPRHVYLIDGSGFIFRAYHALPPMSRPDGTPVNAVYGFTTMVMKLRDDTDADHIAVIFDHARRTFRNDLYPEYKAHRPEPPEDLVPQFDLVRKAVRALNIACLDKEGVEADDLIATYTRLAVEAGADVTIVSSDKDLMQLVGPTVTMYDAMRNKRIGPAEVFERFGVGPDKVVDVQALSGDSSDNVPGIRGIGEKTAGQLIAEHGALDDLIRHAGDPSYISGPLAASLKEVEERLFGLAGRKFKIGSPKEISKILFEDMGLKGTKKGKDGAYVADTEFLQTFSGQGQEFCTLVLRWRFLSKFASSFAPLITQHADMARLSRQLVRLKSDVPIADPLETFAVRSVDGETLLAFLEEQAFKSLMARVVARGIGKSASAAAVKAAAAAKPVGAVASPEETPPSGIVRSYELVQTHDALDRWIAEAAEEGMVALDTETTSLRAMRAKLVGVSLALADGKACYIPLAHRVRQAQGTLDLGGGGGGAEVRVPRQIPLEEALRRLKPLLEDPAVLKVGQNVKYDAQVLGHYGIAVTPVDDTMLLSYVLDGGRHGHGMDELSEIHLGHNTIKYKEVVGAGKNEVAFDEVALEPARDYAAEDADVTMRLYHVLKPRLVAERMTTVYETLERPLIPVLEQMERTGIRVDGQALKALSDDFATRLAELEIQVHALAGHAFNVASPKQLGEILFDEMGLPGGKKGAKTGAYVTSADVLEDLAAQGHALPARVLDWRQLAKLKSTYTDALAGEINPATGRVHTCFSMTGAATGRLSSVDPNLQNIPIRTDEGRRIRQAFIAEKGWKLVSADYSQIELRLLAHVAKIDTLNEAFRKGLDIHAMTASQVFGVPIEGMDPMVRRKAKAINFGIIYGISAFGLGRQLGISNGEAGKYIEAYFQRYPGIRDYMERTKAQARQQGFVTTLFGRKVHVQGINDKNPAMRNFSERAAINAPIQGGAADVIKRAMVRLPKALREAGLRTRMLLQVHDELVLEAPEDEVESTVAVARRIMEGAAHLDVPLVVEAGSGKSWAEAH